MRHEKSRHNEGIKIFKREHKISQFADDAIHRFERKSLQLKIKLENSLSLVIYLVLN